MTKPSGHRLQVTFACGLLSFATVCLGGDDRNPPPPNSPPDSPAPAAGENKKGAAKPEGRAPGKAGATARKKSARARLKVARGGAAGGAFENPPACPQHAPEARRRVAMPRPMAASMPELFMRMGENFARNPATGFQTFAEDLSQFEGPAMEGITLSVAEERRAGKYARAEYLAKAAAKGFRVDNDRERLEYLQSLVKTMSARMRNRNRYPNIEVTLIDAPVSEGQSFPGGYLVFTTELLREPDEATVVGVVAHELAHLDRGHLYEYARRSKLAESTFTRPPGVGGSFDEFFTRGLALFGLMMKPFRPEHELEADCTAATWMYQEGYDPRALVGFFERLHNRLQDQPADPFFTFWRTHPFSLDRRQEVLDRLAQLERWRPRNDLGLYAENLRKLITHGRELAAKAEGEAKAEGK